MKRSLVDTTRTWNALRFALLGAASSLALASVSSATPFVCDDDLANQNFTCGSAANTQFGKNATAVGDQASASDVDATAVLASLPEQSKPNSPPATASSTLSSLTGRRWRIRKPSR